MLGGSSGGPATPLSGDKFPRTTNFRSLRLVRPRGCSSIKTPLTEGKSGQKGEQSAEKNVAVTEPPFLAPTSDIRLFATNLPISRFHSQEQSGGRRGKLSSLRRSLNALRCRISKRGRSKPPDQFLDKFSAASATSDTRLHQAGCVAPQAVPSDGVCSRLSVDPSLPSHYRVSKPLAPGPFARRRRKSIKLKFPPFIPGL